MMHMAEMEEDVGALKKAISNIKALAGQEVLEKELAQKLARHLATNITLKTLIKEGVPVTKLLDRANQITATI